MLNVIGEGVSEELAREVTRVLKQETARNPSHVLVQQEDIALLESLFLFGCESPTPDCMTQLAESLEADRLVYGRLVEVDGLYDIEINIFDRQEGREVSKWNKRFTANANVVGFFTREMEIFLGGRNPESAVVLRVSANVPNALVTIDGKQAGRTPFFTDKLAEGRHSIEVSKEGYVPWSYEGNLTPGVPLNFKASLSVVTSGPPTDDEQDPNEPPQPTVDTTVQLRTLGWTSVGLGAASLVAGGVFGILVLQSERDVEDAEFLEDAQDIEERGERFASLANIFYATGGGLVLLGVILVLVDDNADESFSAFSPTGDPGPRTIEVTPSPLEGGAGVSVEIPW
ncbi:MAG: PEGA domain-containing protein [Myxococcota bacterium]